MGISNNNTLILIALILLPSIVFFLYVGAFEQPIKNMNKITLVIYDQDNSELSNLYISKLEETQLYNFVEGDVDFEYAKLIIPKGFQEQVLEGKGSVDLLINEKNSYIVGRVIKPNIYLYTQSFNLAINKKYAEKLLAGYSTLNTNNYILSSSLYYQSNIEQSLEQKQLDLYNYNRYLSVSQSAIKNSNEQISNYMKIFAYSFLDLNDAIGSAYGASKTFSNKLSYANGNLKDILLFHKYLLNISYNTSLYPYLLQEYNYLNNFSYSLSSSIYYSNELSNGLEKIYQSTSNNYLFDLYSANNLISQGISYTSLTNKQLSSANKIISNYQDKLSTTDYLLANKLSNNIYLNAQPSVSLNIKSIGKNSYGEFFASVFSILGLFFGASSAEIYGRLNKLSRKKIYFILILQSLFLFLVYSYFGFNVRSFLLLFVFILGAFIFDYMVRALISLLFLDFSYKDLQILSPILSLLAVFMVSSGGSVWPPLTLQPLFSNFYILLPFNYIVEQVRNYSLLASGDLSILLLIAIIYLLLERLFIIIKNIYVKQKKHLS